MVQPNRIVRCLTFLGGQSVDMFAYKLLVHGFSLRLKSIVCGAAVFLIICIMKNEKTKTNKKKMLKMFLGWWTVACWPNANRSVDRNMIFTYFKARKRLPGNSVLVGAAQTSKGALTVQKARMLHFYQLQKLSWNSSWNEMKQTKNNLLKRFKIRKNKIVFIRFIGRL